MAQHYEPRPMIARLIVTEAPPRPACFDTDESWREYLRDLYEAGIKITKRSDTGKHSGHRVVKTVFAIAPFQQCHDCAIGGAYQRKMEAEGRCELAIAHAKQAPAGL